MHVFLPCSLTMCSAWWGWWPGYSLASARPPSDSSSDGRQANKTKSKPGHFQVDSWGTRISTHLNTSQLVSLCWMFIKVVKTFTQQQTTPKLEVVESQCQYRPGANGHFMHYSLIAKTIWCWFFFYTAPSSITCCRDEYKAENKVMCDVKPAFGWINSGKIRPKCQEKRQNTFRRPPRVHGFQSSRTFLSLVLVNSKIDYEMKKKKPIEPNCWLWV